MLPPPAALKFGQPMSLVAPTAAGQGGGAGGGVAVTGLQVRGQRRLLGERLFVGEETIKTHVARIVATDLAPNMIAIAREKAAAQAIANAEFAVERPEDAPWPDAAFDAVLAKVKASAAQTVVPDTTVEVTTQPSFPPFHRDAAGDQLTALAQGVYGELGRKLETHGTGGASESALAQAVGTPALDGLGFVGSDFHTDHEWIDLNSISPRIYLTARLIEELGRKPPVKPAS